MNRTFTVCCEDTYETVDGETKWVGSNTHIKSNNRKVSNILEYPDPDFLYHVKMVACLRGYDSSGRCNY